MTKRSRRFGLRLSQAEREGLTRLAEIEGLPEAATLRRLLRQAIKTMPADPQPPQPAAEPKPEGVPHAQAA